MGRSAGQSVCEMVFLVKRMMWVFLMSEFICEFCVLGILCVSANRKMICLKFYGIL